MKFEEEFPSLVKFVMVAGKYEILPVAAVENHCLDKQRVRDILERGAANAEQQRQKCIKLKDPVSVAAHRGAGYAFESLIKELGLNEPLIVDVDFANGIETTCISHYEDDIRVVDSIKQEKVIELKTLGAE